MRLTHDRVLVRKDPIVNRVGAIWLPDRAKKRPQIGTVLAIGPEVRDINVGDRVIVGRYAGVDLDGTEQVIVWQRDIIAVLNE